MPTYVPALAEYCKDEDLIGILAKYIHVYVQVYSPQEDTNMHTLECVHLRVVTYKY